MQDTQIKSVLDNQFQLAEDITGSIFSLRDRLSAVIDHIDGVSPKSTGGMKTDQVPANGTIGGFQLTIARQHDGLQEAHELITSLENILGNE